MPHTDVKQSLEYPGVLSSIESRRLRLPSQLFVTLASYTKTTLHAVMTWPPVGGNYLCWNPKSHHSGVRYARWWWLKKDFVLTLPIVSI